MKKCALFALILAALALMMLAGCKNETMLDNYTSDKYELGEEDTVTWDDIF